MKKFHSVIVFLVAILLALSSCSQELTKMAVVPKDRVQQIIQHTGYTVSYNTQWLIPNWVAYELTSSEAQGMVKRNGDFMADPEANGPVVTKFDYSNSGYDRGHMAPAGDMKWSQQAMTESFYLTNICPQNPNLNGGDWRILEEKIRDWAKQYGSLLIVCGPIVEKNHQTIGQYNSIAVPSSFFKVILRKTSTGYEGIGFLFPNVAGHKNLSAYATTIDAVEQATGINFFTHLSAKDEKTVELIFSLKAWNLQ